MRRAGLLPRAVSLALLSEEGGFAEGKDGRSQPRFFILRGCFFDILHASSRRGTSFARGGKGCKAPFLVRRKIMGTPKSPIGFLGKRKHNEAMSFFRVSEKTISGVRADEVAVNFSAYTLL